MPPTLYSARFDTPDLLQRGRTEVLECRVYRAGALVAPTEAGSTVTIYDGDNDAVVSAAAVTVTGDVATYSLSGATTAALEYSKFWRVVWALIMPDGVTHTFEQRAALVRRVPHPVVTEASLYARVRALDPSSSAPISTRTSYEDTIDEAWKALVNRLIESDLRIEGILDPSSLRETHLCLVLAMVFEDLAARNPAYQTTADSYRKQYETAWSRLSPQIDDDDDGQSDGAKAARGPVWCM